MKRYDVVVIGNAIVDILAFREDAFLAQYQLVKGSMTLIGEELAQKLAQDLPEAARVAGGSAANTAYGVASFGGKAAFIGKVKQDAAGDAFRHSMHEAGVYFPTASPSEGPPTASCYVVVNPSDSERTMSTFLGIASQLKPSDMDEDVIAQAKILYTEGFLWDGASTSLVLKQAMQVAERQECLVAFTLSDAFCVERHLASFRDPSFLQMIDILFMNETEAMMLFDTQTREATVEAASKRVGKPGCITVMTCNAHGSYICQDGTSLYVAPAPVSRLVDSTGAGDYYASGFLYGYSHGMPLEACGALASQAASEVIAQLGARPAAPLTHLLQKRDSAS